VDGEIDPETAYDQMYVILVDVLVDEDGDPLFTAADLDALRAKSPAVVQKLARVSMRLSGVSDEAIAEAQETIKKARSASSSSPSQTSKDAHSEAIPVAN
jgi:hypothetical protein